MRWFVLAAAALGSTVAASAQPPGPVPPPNPPLPIVDDDYPADLAKKNKELIPALIEALKDFDQEVRQHSAMALASLGPIAVPSLQQALTDSIKERRAAAAYALGQMGYAGKDAIPDLLKALKDDEAVVRRSASQAINRILSGDLMLAGFGAKPIPNLVPGVLGGRGSAVPALPPTGGNAKPVEKPK